MELKKQIMKPLRLFSAFLVFTLGSQGASAQFDQSQLVKEWQRAKAYTKEYLDAMPQDGYGFKPTPDIRSFAGQMLHIADVNYFFASLASGKSNPLGETIPAHNVAEKTFSRTKDSTTKAVMDSYDWLIGILENMTPTQLQETINFAKQDITRSGMFGKAFEHQTHHRGQTTIYLRLKGVMPPGEKLF
jgi:uncharacterized damage-inducible protein DinB